MTEHDRIDDLDLLAFADGLLEDDPGRRAAVAALLERSPEARARVERWRAQNAALRAAYDPRLHEPTPDRLLAALEGRPRAGMRRLAQAAALLCLAGGAAALGWRAGEIGETGWSADRFAGASYESFVAGAAPEGSGASPLRPAALGAAALGELEEVVSVQVAAPDLSDAGFSLVGEPARTGPGGPVRLDYAAADGRAFSLFIGPRWETRPAEVAQVERGDVALAWWLDGPLASAVVGRLPGAELEGIAQEVRHAMRRGRETPPPPGAPPSSLPDAGIMADSLTPAAGGDPAARPLDAMQVAPN